jgi:hypothetical protein
VNQAWFYLVVMLIGTPVLVWRIRTETKPKPVPVVVEFKIDFTAFNAAMRQVGVSMDEFAQRAQKLTTALNGFSEAFKNGD